MQKNLYFRTMYRRRNLFKERILDLFDGFASYPKLTLEVFIRKNFGERYINVASVVTVGMILLILPVVAHSLAYFPGIFMRSTGIGGYGGYQDYSSSGIRASFWNKYTSWYLFLAGFLFMAVKRLKEVKRNPSVFDFERFSLYSGDIHPFFFHLPLSKARPDVRQVEILYEPAPFFLAGIVLWLLGQSLGWLLVIGSITYSVSYAAAYKRGDDLVGDTIDQMILNEEMEAAFVDGLDASETRGVRLYLRKPTDKDLRRKLASAMVEEGDDDIAVAV